MQNQGQGAKLLLWETPGNNRNKLQCIYIKELTFSGCERQRTPDLRIHVCGGFSISTPFDVS